MRQVLQSPRLWAAVAVLVWLTGVWVAIGLPGPFELPPEDRSLGGRGAWAIAVTAWWATAFWAWGSSQMLWLTPSQWAARGGWVRVAGLVWLLGAVMLLLHMAAAFTFRHHWSLTKAYLNTQESAGVGDGLFVNFAFALVWVGDALWLVAGPESYARRPRWVGWAVHGFLAFVTFNAAVVFASPPVRWAGAGWFALLAFELGRWAWRRQRVVPSPPDRPEGRT